MRARPIATGNRKRFSQQAKDECQGRLNAKGGAAAPGGGAPGAGGWHVGVAGRGCGGAPDCLGGHDEVMAQMSWIGLDRSRPGTELLVVVVGAGVGDVD